MSNAELNEAARHYDGPYKPYDLIRELCVAIAVVGALAVLLTIFFSSPDERPSTIAQWSRQMPVDFVSTAVSELDGSSGTAGYGPPYNHNGDGQQIAFIHLQKWLGVSHPIDTAQDFVLTPLASIPFDPALRKATAAYQAASAKTQTAWTTATNCALGKATRASAGGPRRARARQLRARSDEMNALLGLAQSGGLDGDLLTSNQFFQTDYTRRCCSWPTAVCWPLAPSRNTCSATSGA